MYLEKGTEEKFPTIIKIPNMLQHFFLFSWSCPYNADTHKTQIFLCHDRVVIISCCIWGCTHNCNFNWKKHFSSHFFIFIVSAKWAYIFFTFVIFNINNDNLRYDINTIQKDRTENTCNKNYVTWTLLRHNCVIVTFYVCCMMGRICN